MNESKVKKQRKEILRLHNDKCDKCETNENLQIHHPHYEHPKISELQVLCRKCHKELHKNLPKLSNGNQILIRDVSDEEYDAFKGAVYANGESVKGVLIELMKQYTIKNKR